MKKHYGILFKLCIFILVVLSECKQIIVEVTQSTCNSIAYTNCGTYKFIICYPPPSMCTKVQFTHSNSCLEESDYDGSSVKMQFAAGNNHTYKYKKITEYIFVAVYNSKYVYTSQPVEVLCQTSPTNPDNTIELEDSTGQNTMTLKMSEIESETSPVLFETTNLIATKTTNWTTTETTNNKSVTSLGTTLEQTTLNSTSLQYATSTNTFNTSSNAPPTGSTDNPGPKIGVVLAIVFGVAIPVISVMFIGCYLYKHFHKTKRSVGDSPPLIQDEAECEAPETDDASPVNQQTVLIENEKRKSLSSSSSSDDKSDQHSEPASTKSDQHSEKASRISDDENQDVNSMPTETITNKNQNGDTSSEKVISDDELSRTEELPEVSETAKTSDETTDQDHMTKEGDKQHEGTENEENRNKEDDKETNDTVMGDGTDEPLDETGEVEKAEEDTKVHSFPENDKITGLMNDVLTVPDNVETSINSTDKKDLEVFVNDDQGVAAPPKNKNTKEYNDDEQVIASDNNDQREATTNKKKSLSNDNEDGDEIANFLANREKVDVSSEVTIPTGTAAEIPRRRKKKSKRRRRQGTEQDGENIRSESYERQMQEMMAANEKIQSLDSRTVELENQNGVRQKEVEKLNDKYEKHKQKTKQKLKKLSDRNRELREDLDESNKMSEARKQEVKRLTNRIKDVEKNMDDVKSRVLSNEQALTVVSQQATQQDTELLHIRKGVDIIRKSMIRRSMIKEQNRRRKKRRRVYLVG